MLDIRSRMARPATPTNKRKFTQLTRLLQEDHVNVGITVVIFSVHEQLHNHFQTVTRDKHHQVIKTTSLENVTNLLDLIAEMEKLVAGAANLFRELRT